MSGPFRVVLCTHTDHRFELEAGKHYLCAAYDLKESQYERYVTPEGLKETLGKTFRPTFNIENHFEILEKHTTL